MATNLRQLFDALSDSEFAGIGSEGWCSLLRGRRFVGIELKDTYFREASKNLEAAEKQSSQAKLFV